MNYCTFYSNNSSPLYSWLCSSDENWLFHGDLFGMDHCRDFPVVIQAVSLLLPRLPKLPSLCYWNGPGNLGILGSNKEIQPGCTLQKICHSITIYKVVHKLSSSIELHQAHQLIHLIFRATGQTLQVPSLHIKAVKHVWWPYKFNYQFISVQCLQTRSMKRRFLIFLASFWKAHQVRSGFYLLPRWRSASLKVEPSVVEASIVVWIKQCLTKLLLC